ncbi:MAG TPA: ATP-binding cassette domain-containing protein [Polyangiaceae bacterium]|nr:ATP-binding cassette domain-containing protein [Polyangiaceae bacterium]
MITLENVSKSFSGRPALSEVDLKVPRGCLYGLIGPGAAGKTLVLKAICGLITPDSGRVVCGGNDVGRLSPAELSAYRRSIGMQFQNNALFDFMTVAENIAFPLRRLMNLSDDEVRLRVAERLTRVQLPGFEDRSPSGLSGGQKRRIGIARATVTRPPIVLCDEPAAGLDPVTSLRIFELLRAEQRAANSTVILVSSDVDRLLTVTDRIGMMHEGRLVFDGTTAEARESTNPLIRQFLRGALTGPL